MLEATFLTTGAFAFLERKAHTRGRRRAAFLAGQTIASVALGFHLLAAILAALGLVLEPFASVELLLTHGEGPIAIAVLQQVLKLITTSVKRRKNKSGI